MEVRRGFDTPDSRLILALTDLERTRLIARFFSRPVLLDIARRGTAAHVVEELKKLGVDAGVSGASAADFFEASFEAVDSAYRCEYVYKTAIANRIVFGRHSPRTSSLHIELPVAGSIVDAAVFNGVSTAYEIKTEYDSHRRLKTQTPAYLKAFERVFVVCHPSAAEYYAGVLDERVGVLILNENNQLKEIRSSSADVSRIDPSVVFRMLRREEFIKAVQDKWGPQPKMSNGLVHSHYSHWFLQLSSEEAHRILVKAMKARTTGVDDVEFLSAVPKSLRALACATPLSRPQRHKLLSALALAA